MAPFRICEKGSAPPPKVAWVAGAVTAAGSRAPQRTALEQPPGPRRQFPRAGIAADGRRRGPPAAEPARGDVRGQHRGGQQSQHADHNLNVGQGELRRPQKPGPKDEQHDQTHGRAIAKPPHRNASSCSIGRGLLGISTVMPIRNGSRLTATAITRMAIHMAAGRCLAGRLGLKLTEVVDSLGS